MMHKAGILLFGDINLDVSMPISKMPIPGQDVYVNKLSFSMGGSATNTAVILNQLGLKPFLFGSIGTDLNGDRLFKYLTESGLDIRYILRKSELPSGQIFVTILPGGERNMYSYRGTNALTSPEDIPQDWVNRVDLIHLSGYVFLKSPQRDTAFALIETARQHHIPICIDTGFDPVFDADHEMKSILPMLDICICGIKESSILTGKKDIDQAIDAFLDLGLDCVAIKLGDQGCMVACDGENIHMPALSINAIDTTGSGDAFSAGILYGWLNKFTLPDLCMLANTLGANLATKLGSMSLDLSWVSIGDFLNQIRENQTNDLKSCIDKLMEKISTLS